MEKLNFIRTQSEDTKDILLKEGFTFLQKEGNQYVFLNDSKMNFSTEDKDIVYTNIMCV